MSNQDWEDQPQFDDRVTLPNRNMEWADAVVKWTRYDYVAVYDYPTTQDSDTVMEIYKGDMIHVSLRYRREDWCLCQIGHVLGWVFLQDVRFIVPGMRSSRRKRPRPRQDSPAPAQTQQDAYEMETEPVIPAQQMEANLYEAETKPPAVAQVAPVGADKKPMIERLIKFFKR